MEANPSEEDVDKLGETSPEKLDWKEGVEEEWARPPLLAVPGMNSAMLFTDGCKRGTDISTLID